MPFNLQLAERVRNFLAQSADLVVEEKKMFKGLAFMVNHKMCINVSGDNLMCRFDPAKTAALSHRKGFLPMIMKGKAMDGYCYVEAAAVIDETDLAYWIGLCLEYNPIAKASKRQPGKR